MGVGKMKYKSSLFRKRRIFVTGTDTDVGKTIVSAGLCLNWSAHYWKPIQAGYLNNTFTSDRSILPGTDNEIISHFIPKKHIFPSAYNLKNPLSPNQAAKKEGITIKIEKINCPDCSFPLVIEGAGGCLVPVNDTEDMTDIMKKMECPVIVVARSTLGTLNHTLLTLSVLRAKEISILGVIMVGPFHFDNKMDIEKKGNIPILLELPILKNLSPEVLKSHFSKLSLT